MDGDLLRGDDQHREPVADTQVGEQGGVRGGELGLHLREGGRFPDLAAALAVPAALPDRGGELVAPPGLRRARGRLRAVQHPELGQVGGQLRVVRGAHRGHPPDQGPGALGPLEDPVRAAVVERRAQPQLGEVTAVADQRALQVEAAERGLPGVQVGQAGADVAPGEGAAAVRLVELGLDLAPVQPHGEGVRRRAPGLPRAALSRRRARPGR